MIQPRLQAQQTERVTTRCEYWVFEHGATDTAQKVSVNGGDKPGDAVPHDGGVDKSSRRHWFMRSEAAYVHVECSVRRCRCNQRSSSTPHGVRVNRQISLLIANTIDKIHGFNINGTFRGMIQQASRTARSRTPLCMTTCKRMCHRLSVIMLGTPGGSQVCLLGIVTDKRRSTVDMKHARWSARLCNQLCFDDVCSAVVNISTRAVWSGSWCAAFTGQAQIIERSNSIRTRHLCHSNNQSAT